MRKFVLFIGTLLVLLPVLSAQDLDDIYKIKKQNRISSGMDEAGAVPYEDDIVYISEATSIGASSPRESKGRRLFTMFQVTPGTGQKKQFVDQFVSKRHEGPVSFSGDFKTMVFSQQRPSSENRDYDPLGLYFAEKSGDEWSLVGAFEHNNPQAWLFSPSLSKDGNTLIFSSNMDGGEGGFDLYVSYKEGGGWSKPENLGPRVNTAGHEIYPFIHESGRLIFSSSGLGDERNGYDLFQTILSNGSWASAARLSEPLNSRRNDYHVWFSDDMKMGYLTSDRRGGSKDIFEVELLLPVAMDDPKPMEKTFYKYRIYDKKLDSVDTRLFNYSWTINDTLTIPGHEIIYRFPGEGTYVCKMNVYDIQLDTLMEGQAITTLDIRRKEQAVIICPKTVQVGVPVEFDATRTNLPSIEEKNRNYYWDFGDGNYGQGEIVQHTYNYPGTFKVILGVEEKNIDKKSQPREWANEREVVVISE